MKKQKILSFIAGAVTVASLGAGLCGVKGQTVSAAEFKQVYQFEDANHFSSDYGNGIRNDSFGGYQGSGYVYLAQGWADVNFTVPQSGKYRITIATNSDQYKENWLYIDDSSAGKITTNGNSWQQTTVELDLSAGEHKFGVSSDWGYVALDYIIVEQVDGNNNNDNNNNNNNNNNDNNNNNNNNQGVSTGSLSVNGTTLYDKQGQPFVMRGVNVAHGWYADKTYTSINAIANLGANTVRVVLCDGSQWTRTTEGEVNNIINWCKEKGLICVLEVHDYTGYNDASNIDGAVNYWKSMKDLLNANKDTVIVNIANEWLGDWSKSSMWASTYANAVRNLRNAGIENVLMVDAPGYGQQIQPAIDGCQEVRNADTTGNTIFSLHMYSVAGKDSYTVRSNIDGMLSKGVCTVIGEFGDFQNGGDVDEGTIMDYSNQKQVGTIAWSWKGNGGSDASLDISNDWEGSNLTGWGQNVFYSQYGIKNTSKLASK